MPLLKVEPEIFPSNILELASEEYPWWVAHVRSRQEKALARYLRPLEVPFYVPQVENRKKRGGRNFVSHLPLLPGYVFFRGNSEERLTALRSDLLVRVLEVSDQDLLTEELSQIRKLQEAGASLVRLPELAPGDPVRITEGPFTGYVGVVLRHQGRTRLMVSISMLRQSVAVELPRELVAPIAPRPSFEQSRSAARV
jgi:transcription antitermination factor NusG